MKVINAATIRAERREAAEKVNTAVVHCGSAQANLSDVTGRLARRFTIEDRLTNAENIEEMQSLRHTILGKYKSAAEVEAVLRNAEPSPASAEIEAFFGRFFIDATRRVMEAGDLTGFIADETVNPNFPNPVYKRHLLKFRGAMEEISGENDKPPMIQQNTGELSAINLRIMGLGWKDSIGNMLWNEFFSMDKVVQAFVDAYTDFRNNAVIGKIVGATFVASQSQAAAETETDFTYDEKMYSRILAGVEKLRGLRDPQTGRKISAAAGIRWLGNSANTWSVENVIRGQLNGNNSGVRNANRPALPIDMMLEYDQGINDGFTIGKKEQSFPGVAAGYGYLFIPGYALVATKRGLTYETGQGSVLDFATEERAAYCAQGEDLGDLLGSSAATPVGGAAGYGAIVKVTLPTRS